MRKAIFISTIVVLLMFGVVYAAQSTADKVKAAKTQLTARQKCLDDCLVKFKECRKPCFAGKAGVACKKKCDDSKVSCIQKCPASRRR